MRKKLPQELLRELLKNSRRSDRELAKVLGVSQPTITRARRKLVDEGIIKTFTLTPDPAKMGFEILAITFGKYMRASTPERVEKAREYMRGFPNVIFASRCEGRAKNGVIVSLHKNYSDYARFRNKLRVDWTDEMQNHESLLVPLKGIVVKPLSFEYLAEQEETG
jgi:DNA-binding Lrp family transcriptional regulator